MAWLMVKLASGKARGHEILEDVTFLGRDEDCQIRVSDPAAASKHCQVLRQGANLKLLDLGSAAGTRVNGQRVKERLLIEGDRIQIGAVEIQFKAGAMPARAPGAGAAAGGAVAAPRPAAPAPLAAAVAAPAARPAVASTKRRVSAATARGRRGRHEEEEDEEVHKNPHERFVARDAASPVWVRLLIIGASIGLLIFLFVKFMGTNRTTRAHLDKAQMLAATGSRDLALLEAEAAMKSAEPGTADYAAAKNIYDRIKGETEVRANLESLQDEDTVYQSNIKKFYEEYIDSTSKKFKDVQFKDDPSTARYFVEYRCDPYLKRFPNGANAGTVRAWAESMKRRYDAASPFPKPGVWWDVEVIATFESKLEHHGPAYKLRKAFRDANPDYKNLKDVDQEIADEKHYGENLARFYVAKIKENIADKRFGLALGFAKKGCENLTGIPGLVDQMKAEAAKIAEAAKAAGFVVDLTVLDEWSS